MIERETLTPLVERAKSLLRTAYNTWYVLLFHRTFSKTMRKEALRDAVLKLLAAWEAKVPPSTALDIPSSVPKALQMQIDEAKVNNAAPNT